MSAELVRKLSALGLNLEQVAGVMDIMDAEAESRKEKGRERWHKWKSNKGANVSKRLSTDANVSSLLTRAEDSSSKIEITGKEEKKESAAKPRGLDDFRSELSSILDSERIEALVAVRRKKGATFSAHAGKLLVNALRACPSVTEAADEMVLRNWTGIKPEWLESRQQQAQPRAGAPPTHAEQVNAALDRIINGKSNEPPTIETGFERRDSRGSEVPLRLVASPQRN